MPSILFVCTANQFRSPIAAACFSKKLVSMQWKGDWIIQSAGTWTTPGAPAIPAAIAAARKIGVSLDGHVSKHVTPELISTQDLILVMELGHKEALQNEFPLFSKRILLISEVVQDKVEEVADPVMSDSDSFIETAVQINEMIERGFYRICGKALKATAYRDQQYSAPPDSEPEKKTATNITINKERLLQKIDILAETGALESNGVSRLALTDADKAGRGLIVSWMQTLGLTVHIDEVGNIFGVRSGEEELLPVMFGSHIDTVTISGRYDGSYGVIAALEVIHVLNDNNIKTRLPLAVAVFSNQEGVRYNHSLLGSSVYVGEQPVEQAYAIQGIDGSNFGEELKGIGFAGSMESGSIQPYAFLELHIEQGSMLEQLNIPIGVVEMAPGTTWLEATVVGKANHAGTIDGRQDAGLAAAKLITSLQEIASAIGGKQRATCGRINYEPNTINVIPGKVTFTVDLSNTVSEDLVKTEKRLYTRAKEIEANDGVEITFRALEHILPVKFDQAIVDMISQVTSELGLSSQKMISSAGHDAQMMAQVCPTAMIFVPSRDGLSHNPDEYTSLEHLETGANVLLHTVMKLAT